MKNKKIFFFLPSLRTGGAERQLVYLACTLAKQDYSVTVGTFYEGGLFWEELKGNSEIRIIAFKHSRRDLIGCCVRLFIHLRREKYDIFQAFIANATTIGLVAAAAAGIKNRFVGIRSTFIRYGGYKDIGERINTFLQRLIYNMFATRIIYNSHSGKNYHEALGYKRNKSSVVWNGIPLPSLIETNITLRYSLSIPATNTLITAVGRISPVKDYITLLKSAVLLRSRNIPITLLIVGSGDTSYLNKLISFIQDNILENTVHFLGERHDILNILSATDIYVTTSLSEGCSNTVLEAMSLGKRIIATDAGDNRLLLDDGRGTIVPVGAPEALALAIEQVMKKGETTNVAALEFVKKELSLETLVHNYEKLWLA